MNKSMTRLSVSLLMAQIDFAKASATDGGLKSPLIDHKNRPRGNTDISDNSTSTLDSSANSIQVVGDASLESLPGVRPSFPGSSKGQNAAIADYLERKSSSRSSMASEVAAWQLSRSTNSSRSSMSAEVQKMSDAKMKTKETASPKPQVVPIPSLPENVGRGSWTGPGDNDTKNYVSVQDKKTLFQVFSFMHRDWQMMPFLSLVPSKRNSITSAMDTIKKDINRAHGYRINVSQGVHKKGNRFIGERFGPWVLADMVSTLQQPHKPPLPKLKLLKQTSDAEQWSSLADPPGKKELTKWLEKVNFHFLDLVGFTEIFRKMSTKPNAFANAPTHPLSIDLPTVNDMKIIASQQNQIWQRQRREGQGENPLEEHDSRIFLNPESEYYKLPAGHFYFFKIDRVKYNNGNYEEPEFSKRPLTFQQFCVIAKIMFGVSIHTKEPDNPFEAAELVQSYLQKINDVAAKQHQVHEQELFDDFVKKDMFTTSRRTLIDALADEMLMVKEDNIFGNIRFTEVTENMKTDSNFKKYYSFKLSKDTFKDNQGFLFFFGCDDEYTQFNYDKTMVLTYMELLDLSTKSKERLNETFEKDAHVEFTEANKRMLDENGIEPGTRGRLLERNNTHCKVMITEGVTTGLVYNVEQRDLALLRTGLCGQEPLNLNAAGQNVRQWLAQLTVQKLLRKNEIEAFENILNLLSYDHAPSEMPSFLMLHDMHLQLEPWVEADRQYLFFIKFISNETVSGPFSLDELRTILFGKFGYDFQTMAKEDVKALQTTGMPPSDETIAKHQCEKLLYDFKIRIFKEYPKYNRFLEEVSPPDLNNRRPVRAQSMQQQKTCFCFGCEK